MEIENLNKPKKQFWDNKYVDNKKVIAEYWWLKPTISTNFVTQVDTVYNGVQSRIDTDYRSRDVIVVGTKLQIYRLFAHMLKHYAWQLKDNWKHELKDCYLKQYKENDNKPIIINVLNK